MRIMANTGDCLTDWVITDLIIINGQQHKARCQSVTGCFHNMNEKPCHTDNDLYLVPTHRLVRNSVCSSVYYFVHFQVHIPSTYSNPFNLSNVFHELSIRLTNTSHTQSRITYNNKKMSPSDRLVIDRSIKTSITTIHPWHHFHSFNLLTFAWHLRASYIQSLQRQFQLGSD